MKRSKFTEEQIIGILRGAGSRCEDGGAVPSARDQQRDLLRVEGQVRRDGRVGREAAEGARGGERPSEAAPGGVAARPGCIEGSPVAKVVTPAARREAVAILVEHHEMSERRACTVIGADRTSIRYRSRRPDDRDLRERLRALASERRRFGYRRLHVLLRREGHVVNRKKTQRLYREEGLTVRKRRGRKKATGTRAPLLTVTRPNARWSVDFVHDQFAQGRRFRIFNVIDDVTKECLAAVVRHLDLGPPRRAGTDGPCRTTWQARPHRQRPRHRVHLERDAGLERRCRRALAFHRPGQADAKRHLRGLQFENAGRAPERDVVLRAGSRPRDRRPLGGRLQPRAPTFSPRLPDPCGFRRPTHRNGRSAPRNGSVPLLAHCSLRASGQLSDVGSGFSWMSVGGQSSADIADL